MRTKAHYFLAPVLVGFMAVSCEQKDLDEVSPRGEVMSTELSSLATAANLIFEETFEGTSPFSTAHSIETGTDYALTYVSNPAYQGKKAARFEVRKSDPLVKDGKRSEVTVVSYKQDNKVQKEMWYSFAAYFPSDGYKIDNASSEIINQWKHSSSDGGGSPSTALRVESDRFFLDTGYNDKEGETEVYEDSRKEIDLGQVTKDTWHEFVFHIIHSHESDGLIEVWHNGKKILTHKGGNYYNVSTLPKWKIGIYKSGFKYDDSDVDKRVIYFDNVKVGQKSATFADMDPSYGSTAAPEVTTPEETTPEVTTPEESAPEVTTPEETAPEETTPEETTPEVTTPEETTPEETTPEVTAPEETTPEETTPEETTPEETTPEVTKPGSGKPNSGKQPSWRPNKASSWFNKYFSN